MPTIQVQSGNYELTQQDEARARELINRQLQGKNIVLTYENAIVQARYRQLVSDPSISYSLSNAAGLTSQARSSGFTNVEEYAAVTGYFQKQEPGLEYKETITTQPAQRLSVYQQQLAVQKVNALEAFQARKSQQEDKTLFGFTPVPVTQPEYFNELSKQKSSPSAIFTKGQQASAFGFTPVPQGRRLTYEPRTQEEYVMQRIRSFEEGRAYTETALSKGKLGRKQRELQGQVDTGKISADQANFFLQANQIAIEQELQSKFTTEKSYGSLKKAKDEFYQLPQAEINRLVYGSINTASQQVTESYVEDIVNFLAKGFGVQKFTTPEEFGVFGKRKDPFVLESDVKGIPTSLPRTAGILDTKTYIKETFESPGSMTRFAINANLIVGGALAVGKMYKTARGIVKVPVEYTAMDAVRGTKYKYTVNEVVSAKLTRKEAAEATGIGLLEAFAPFRPKTGIIGVAVKTPKTSVVKEPVVNVKNIARIEVSGKQGMLGEVTGGGSYKTLTEVKYLVYEPKLLSSSTLTEKSIVTKANERIIIQKGKAQTATFEIDEKTFKTFYKGQRKVVEVSDVIKPYGKYNLEIAGRTQKTSYDLFKGETSTSLAKAGTFKAGYQMPKDVTLVPKDLLASPNIMKQFRITSKGIDISGRILKRVKIITTPKRIGYKELFVGSKEKSIAKSFGDITFKKIKGARRPSVGEAYSIGYGKLDVEGKAFKIALQEGKVNYNIGRQRLPTKYTVRIITPKSFKVKFKMDMPIKLKDFTIKKLTIKKEIVDFGAGDKLSKEATIGVDYLKAGKGIIKADYNKKLPLPSESASKVLSKYSLDVFGTKRGYKEAYRILQPGGKIEITSGRDLSRVPKNVLNKDNYLTNAEFKNVNIKPFVDNSLRRKTTEYLITAEKPLIMKPLSSLSKTRLVQAQASALSKLFAPGQIAPPKVRLATKQQSRLLRPVVTTRQTAMAKTSLAALSIPNIMAKSKVGQGSIVMPKTITISRTTTATLQTTTPALASVISPAPSMRINIPRIKVPRIVDFSFRMKPSKVSKASAPKKSRMPTERLLLAPDFTSRYLNLKPIKLTSRRSIARYARDPVGLRRTPIIKI